MWTALALGSEDGQRFYGRYSYCSADPNFPWNGSRR
jgi:hypothetical protein